MLNKILLFICSQIITFQLSRAQNPFKELSQTVGLISYTTKDTPRIDYSGTGTLIGIPVDAGHSKVYIVTNKHVLPKKMECDSVSFRIHQIIGGVDSFLIFHIPIFKKESYRENVKVDPQNEDVAAIDVTGYNIPISVRLLPYSFLATEEIFKLLETSIGDEIIFIGYPSFFYNKKNLSPVLRIGVIATDPRSDFYFSDELRNAHYAKFKERMPKKLNGFLIDANVYAGSSGSLVIQKPKSIFTDSSGHIIHDPQMELPYIFGMTTTSYFDMDDRSAKGVRLNLGGVVSSAAIRRTLDQFK